MARLLLSLLPKTIYFTIKIKKEQQEEKMIQKKAVIVLAVAELQRNIVQLEEQNRAKTQAYRDTRRYGRDGRGPGGGGWAHHRSGGHRGGGYCWKYLFRREASTASRRFLFP